MPRLAPADRSDRNHADLGPLRGILHQRVLVADASRSTSTLESHGRG